MLLMSTTAEPKTPGVDLAKLETMADQVKLKQSTKRVRVGHKGCNRAGRELRSTLQGSDRNDSLSKVDFCGNLTGYRKFVNNLSGNVEVGRQFRNNLCSLVKADRNPREDLR